MDRQDRLPGKVDVTAETGNLAYAVRGKLVACADDAPEERAFPAGILRHYSGQMAKTDEVR